jgi:hypothetical protein
VVSNQTRISEDVRHKKTTGVYVCRLSIEVSRDFDARTNGLLNSNADNDDCVRLL